MWYRTAKQLMKRESGYSKELGYLRDTLQGGINPFDYAFMYNAYLEETNPELAAQMDPDEASGAVERLEQQELDAFKSWLEIQYSNYGNPIYPTMEWRSFARPEWNVHFTNFADDIGENGFQYGHPQVEGLHYTPGNSGTHGFNFAFPADARDANRAERDGKYGGDAVLFYGGGADTYHQGDEENQRLFWGKNVDPRMIFPIKYDREKGGWYVEDATGRTLVEGKDYGDVVRWVQKNYRMLQSIREKQRRKSQT
jgi:hypothetical protein